jgi:hypothetical protein
MRITLQIDLPTICDEAKAIGIPGDPQSTIYYHVDLPFGRVTINASKPLMKIAGGPKPSARLCIFWGDNLTRKEAKADFLATLRERGVSEECINICSVRFDNANAEDEEGNFIRRDETDKIS